VSASANSNTFEGPAWNTQSEYPDLEANEFRHDRADVDLFIKKIEAATDALKPLMAIELTSEGSTPDQTIKLIAGLQAIAELKEQAYILLHNLIVFVQCELSIDATNNLALKIQSELEIVSAKLSSAVTPTQLFLKRASDTIIEAYLAHSHTQAQEFTLKYARTQSDTLLPESEEILLTKLNLHGPQAWANLYNQVSGNLRCRISNGEQEQTMGLAQASELLRDNDESVRHQAWLSIQEAWRPHLHTSAAILNGLAGWRLETYQQRSYKRTLHFLDAPLHAARIQRETLDAMMSAIQSDIEIPRRALRAIAHGLGKTKVDPWDLLATNASPTAGNNGLATAGPSAIANNSSAGLRTFKEGLHLVREAFHAVDPTFGDFVDTMEKNWWIEGRILPNKAQGAYCTNFAKSRTPRVFQTYMGSLDAIGTLAHELGHAYHNWMLRDLPLDLKSYPMTLAETASIFAETALADYLLSTNPNSNLNAQTRLETAWGTAANAASCLLNIPARYEFEKNFYERRQKGFVSVSELNDLMNKAWTKWYGDTISQSDLIFWATKLHFSMGSRSFYNFPYSFGYLFSLGIYSLRKEKGPDFMPSYIALLRDTGCMTAEDLAKKHLDVDITKPEFWSRSLKIVAKQVSAFDQLIGIKDFQLKRPSPLL
jgi:oligoendopeptidase F